MGFFENWTSRKREPDRASRDQVAVDRFWAWWAQEGRASALSSFVEDDAESGVMRRNAVVQELRAHADAIGLAFEMGPGQGTILALAFTPGGDPAKEQLADRWLAGAPTDDPQVAYDNRRQPVPDPSGFEVQIGSTDPEQPTHTIDFASARVRARRRGDGKIDVYVTHDAFGVVGEAAAGQITFIFLDSVLGERAVTESIGVVEHGDVHHDDEVELLALRQIVRG